MKKSVKRIVTMIAAVAMLATSVLSVSAAEINPVKDVNALPYSEGMDASSVSAVVVTSATAAMEQKAYDIISDQIGAKRADKDAIVERLNAMTPEQIKASMSDLTTAIASSEDIKEAMDGAVADVNTAIAAVNKSNADATVVVSNVYNPFNFVEGGAVTEAAKAAVQVYVDEVNAKIEQIKAENASVVISDLANIKPATVITAGSITSSAAASEAMEAVFAEQTAAKTDALNATTVVADKVDFKYGDLNNDGKIKAVDLVIMLQYQLSQNTENPILSQETIEAKGYKIAAGDVVKDGSACDTADLMRLKLFLLEDVAESALGSIDF